MFYIDTSWHIDSFVLLMRHTKLACCDDIRHPCRLTGAYRAPNLRPSVEHATSQAMRQLFPAGHSTIYLPPNLPIQAKYSALGIMLEMNADKPMGPWSFEQSSSESPVYNLLCFLFQVTTEDQDDAPSAGSDDRQGSSVTRQGNHHPSMSTSTEKKIKGPNAKRQSMSSLGISTMYITCCWFSSPDCANTHAKSSFSCYGRHPWQPEARPSWPRAS